MDVRELLASLFTPQQGAALPQAQVAAVDPATMYQPANVPLPPQRPPEFGGPAPQQQAGQPGQPSPSGNILARMPQRRTPGQMFSAGLSGGLSNLQRTPDPWLAFAQGFGGSLKARDAAQSADDKAQRDMIGTLFKAARDAFKEKLDAQKGARDERRLDADIEGKREANRIARDRVDAYRQVAGGKEAGQDDRDYKRAITRKNLLGELKSYRDELGLTRDDEETIPARKMPPDERRRREELYKTREDELRSMLPKIGADGSAPPSDPPQMAPTPAAPSKQGRSLPQGMTPEAAIQSAKDAIAAGKDPEAVKQRLVEFGLPTDGL